MIEQPQGDIDHLRQYICCNYTDTVKFAVSLDDYLISNPVQSAQEFRKFYRSFLSLYLVTNNFLSYNVVLVTKKNDEKERNEIINRVEQWISEVKSAVIKNPVLSSPQKGTSAEKLRIDPTVYQLMQEGIVIFNDYTSFLIRNNIIRIN